MNKSAGFALATLAFAALRFSSAPGFPSTASLSGTEVAAIQHSNVPYFQPASRPPNTPTLESSCTAYLPVPRSNKHAAPDPNLGAATSVIATFFGRSVADSTPLSKTDKDVRYAIAIAPDPRHTNLSLMFDREMAVIQQAAQDDGYTYNSSWLPWRQSTAQGSSLVSNQIQQDNLTAAREACPGLMLFRKSVSNDEPQSPLSNAPGIVAKTKSPAVPDQESDPFAQSLVVFVVGEQPTGGINQDQWDSAIAWLKRNAPHLSPLPAKPAKVPKTPNATAPVQPATRSKLLILGPTFSGSLVSLNRNLQGLTSRPTHIWNGSFVLSGGVSSCDSIEWFKSRLNLRNTSLQNSVFLTFQENDELQIFRLLSYLKDQGTEPNDVAILSEDETAYGSSQISPADPTSPNPSQSRQNPCTVIYATKHRPVKLFYPRDISALRVAYQKQSVFSTVTPSVADKSAHSILQESDQESSGDAPSDTIPNLSGHVTPLSQESVLYDIVSYLRTHHTRYLVLRCTNPLDMLFLCRFFHRAYPEARLVTLGSDMLFRREIDTTEFRGVLSLSSYPLLPRDQHWSALSENPSEDAHRVFESNIAEGTYVAARFLFEPGSIKPPKLQLKSPLSDYADPYWLRTPGDDPLHVRPPTWLTTVGRDGYWPVAVLNSASTPIFPLMGKCNCTAKAPESTIASLDNQDYKRYLVKPPVQGLPFTWQLTLGLAIFLLCYQTYGIFRGYRNPYIGLFTPFRAPQAISHLSPSQASLVGINTALALIILFEVLVVPFIPESDSFSDPIFTCSMSLVIAALAFWLNRRFLLQNYGVVARRAFWISFTILVLTSIAVLRSTVGSRPSSASAFPLFYRMGHLLSGVSPLIPILLLLAGFYLWTWQALAGNLMLSQDRPTLPRINWVQIWAYPGFPGFFYQRWIALTEWMNNQERAFFGLSSKDEINNSASANDVTLISRFEGSARYRISYAIELVILKVAHPFSRHPKILLPPFCIFLLAFFLFRDDLPLLTLESTAFAYFVNAALLLAFLLTTAEALRLFWTWIDLRYLLTAMNRLRLRRTFARLKAVDAHSLWSVSGSVQRVQYLFFSQQLDALVRLSRQLRLRPLILWPSDIPTSVRRQIDDAAECGKQFARDNAPLPANGPNWSDPVSIQSKPMPDGRIRLVFANTVASIYKRVLWPAWSQESSSLSLETSPGAPDTKQRNVFDMELSKNEIVKAAEEFVCLHYIAFIQNILARMRTMTLSMIFLFVSSCFAVSFYPFVPRTEVSIWMMVDLALIGVAVVYVYAGMERDETMSYISNSMPGKLGAEFWIKIAAFMAGPIVGILTTQFPSIADSVLEWLQPGLNAIK